MSKINDISGRRFGRLIVQKMIGINGNGAIWRCLCDCGKITQNNSGNLIIKKGTRSCGCLRIDTVSQIKRKHGHTCRDDGRRGASSTYMSWSGMKDRCLNPLAPFFNDYGGRGITVCDRWINSFENFLSDLGERPLGLTLERINNDGNYELGNCKWATRKEQANNRRAKRNAHILKHEGISKSVTQWAKDKGLSVSTLFARIRLGWSVERTITEPIRGLIQLSKFQL